MGTDVTTAATFTNTANWQGVDDKPTAGSKNIVESGGVNSSIRQVSNKIGNDSGIIYEGTSVKGTKLFDANDVGVGDVIKIERTGIGGYVTFYDKDNQEIWHSENRYPVEKEIPSNFRYALNEYGPADLISTYKITNTTTLNYRVKVIEDKSRVFEHELSQISEVADIATGKIGKENGIIIDGTFTKGDILFTLKDISVGDTIIIERKEDSSTYVTFYDKEGSEIWRETFGIYRHKVVIPTNFYKAVCDYGVQGAKGTFFVTDYSQIQYRLKKLEGNIIDKDSYGVISAKLKIPSENAHDTNQWCELISVTSETNKSIKFLLKKALTTPYKNEVGVCPVPRYNTGLCAGIVYNEVIWHDGYGVGWNTGYIASSPDYSTEKCSLKMIVTFNSITVNTTGSNVRICWYFDENNTDIQWTRYTSSLTNEVITVPAGAKYFAISTQITDTNASVKFDTYAMSANSILLTPDGWNTNLLLGNDSMALRFSGDVTNPTNQDIRLKIDGNAITIYHSSDDSIIATYEKSTYNTAVSLYNELNSLEDFSVEMLDISGVLTSDFIECDVALVSQYDIEKQQNPGTFVTEWDAFPFYFTTKEKEGIYNLEIGIDYSDTNGKKIQAVVNGYPLYSSDDYADDFVNVPLTVTYGNGVTVLKHNINVNGEFLCPIRRMFYVEGMTEGVVNGSGGAAWTCRAEIEEAFDIILKNNGHNIGYEDMMNEVDGDYKTSGPQFVFTSDDNGLSLYTSQEIRNMFVKKGIHPATFFILDNTSKFESYLPIIKACLNTGYFCSVHSPSGYSANINVGRLKYIELVDAVQQTFTKFVELFDRQPVVWDFHRDGESYNTVRYIINHGYKFVMGGGYGSDYGLVSTITKYRIKRFGIRPDAQGQNVRMPDDWLFKKY